MKKIILDLHVDETLGEPLVGHFDPHEFVVPRNLMECVVRLVTAFLQIFITVRL